MTAAEYIAKLLDQAPPASPEQVAKVAAVLLPAEPVARPEAVAA